MRRLSLITEATPAGALLSVTMIDRSEDGLVETWTTTSVPGAIETKIIVRTFDELGRLVSKETDFDADGIVDWSEHLSYDAQGRLQRRELWPSGWLNETWSYDDAGRPARIDYDDAGGWWVFLYAGDFTLKTLFESNGEQFAWETEHFDALGRLTNQDSFGPDSYGGIQKDSYEYLYEGATTSPSRETFSVDDVIQSVREYEYDHEGHVVLMRYDFNADGQFDYVTSYIYE